MMPIYFHSNWDVGIDGNGNENIAVIMPLVDNFEIELFYN